MSDKLRITGAPTEFEAAVIAVVVDRLVQEEAVESAKSSSSETTSRPAWVRAVSQERPGEPRDQVWPGS